MKKLLTMFLLALALTVLITSCGLVSGTAFVSQKIDGNIDAQSGAGGVRGGSNLDALGGAVVDLTDNADYGNIDVNGIEAGCVRTHAVNHLSTPISGEIWITLNTTLETDDPDVVRAAGFRVFHGIALLPNEDREFTCEQTLELIENLDQFENAVHIGKFKVWGMGNEASYSFTLDNIYVGLFLTGSLQ